MTYAPKFLTALSFCLGLGGLSGLRQAAPARLADLSRPATTLHDGDKMDNPILDGDKMDNPILDGDKMDNPILEASDF